MSGGAGAPGAAIVRDFRRADTEGVAALCEAMQAHYGVACPPRPAIVADLLDLPPGVRLLVAEGGGGIVGLAFLSPLYPGPGLRKGLYLKELYVAASARGGGVGRALLAAIAALAVQGGYGRVDWTAAAGDARLMAYYEGLGAVPDPKRAFLRLTGDALSRLAEGSHGHDTGGQIS